METDKETWILYQTTNVCNGKIYVGVHKVQNTSRSRKYLGSGNNIKRAIEKYGRKNFTRVTLAEFSCAKDAYAAEAEMVTEEFVKREDTYNLTMGGVGTVGVKGRPKSEEHKAKIAAAHSRPETKAKLRAANGGVNHSLYGKHHTEATKAKISAFRSTEEFKAKFGASRSGEKHPMCVAVVVNGVYYPTLKFAGEAEKVFPTTVSDRIANTKPKWEGWRYATESEKLEYASRKLQ
jgi:group I intron endonuclease